MKNYNIRLMHRILLIFVFGIFSLSTLAQNKIEEGTFGLALNSNINGEFYLFQFTPSFIYTKGKNQLELGVGFNPTNRQSQKLLNADFNYRYYPNERGQKYNLFFVSNLSYLKRSINSFYPAQYNYFFLNGGYGLEVKPLEKLYLSTSVSAGTFTFNKRSETQHEAFISQDLFDEFGFVVSFQFSVGFRF